jgi:serine/threonine protein kinase
MGQLSVLKKLGEGQFGKVFLVKNKADGALFALKCIQKQQII